MRENSREKKVNPFKLYFSNFGIRQISDLTILAGAIVVLFGLIFDTKFSGVNVLTLIGGIIYALGACARIYVSVKAFLQIKNKRSPLYRQSIINFVMVGLLLVLAILLIIFSIV